MTPREFKPGDRVRVKEPSTPLDGRVGKVIEVSATTAVVEIAQFDQWRFHLSALTHLPPVEAPDAE